MEAGQLMLKAQVAAAESLSATAVTRSPRSKRAKYRTARFHYDNGDRHKGLQLLRQYGMLLDVLLRNAEPDVDGELSDSVWSRAASVDSSFQLSMRHIWTDDIIELFIDANFDHKTYFHTGVNSLRVTDENWIKGDRRQMRSREQWEDEEWSAGARLATHVGADY